MTSIPKSLLETIRSGDCIAFVGAGFSGAAGLPSWSGLLTELADRPEVSPKHRAHVRALVDLKTAHAYDEAAQAIEDTLTRPVFARELAARLQRPEILPEPMQRRLRWLQGIPFRAIVTVNFDGLLSGRTPSATGYRGVLLPEARNPWWKGFFNRATASVPVLKLHGDVGSPETIVITRRDYRRLLYASPGYQVFVRALLANHPVLYLGFSFTDAYINEIRSEILALVGYDGQGPVAHAIVNDVPELTREHYLRHEGVRMLTYDTKKGQDFSGFDEILREIHDETNPISHFGKLLRQKRLLWVDPNPGNNEHIARFFALSKEVAAVARTPFHIHTVATADEGLQALAAAAAGSSPFDLVISHWGGARAPTAVRLLEGMRRQDLRSPVLIFSSQHHAETRKTEALALGAQGYYFSNDGLLRGIERVLNTGEDRE